MAKWLKLYAIYTFFTSPNPRHYTTLLNAAVLNVYLTLHLLQSDCSDLVSKWRGHAVATTFLLRGHCEICAGCQRTSFFVFQRDGALMHREHNTAAFLERERERDARDASSSKRLCPCTPCAFRAWTLTILSWSVMTTLLNEPYFSLLCANSVIR